MSSAYIVYTRGVLKMKAHSKNESTFQNWMKSLLKWLLKWQLKWQLNCFLEGGRLISKMKAPSGHESTSQKWKHVLKMKVHLENECTFQEWKYILKMKAYFKIVQTKGKCQLKWLLKSLNIRSDHRISVKMILLVDTPQLSATNAGRVLETECQNILPNLE